MRCWGKLPRWLMTRCPYVVEADINATRTDGTNHWLFQQKTYVCTSDAVRNGHCNSTELGRFIIDVPEGKSLANTSFWTARLGFREQENTQPASGSNESRENGLWDNPEGNPSPPSDPYTSPWKRSGSRLSTRAVEVRQTSSEPAASILWYNEPIHYEVKRTGYYCVGAWLEFPLVYRSLNKMQPSSRWLFCLPEWNVKQIQTSPSTHRIREQCFSKTRLMDSYPQVIIQRLTWVDFQLKRVPYNAYIQPQFYLCLVIAYVGIAAAWSWLCFKHKDELLPIQVCAISQDKNANALVDALRIVLLVKSCCIFGCWDGSELGWVTSKLCEGSYVNFCDQHIIDTSTLMDGILLQRLHSCLLVSRKNYWLFTCLTSNSRYFGCWT